MSDFEELLLLYSKKHLLLFAMSLWEKLIFMSWHCMSLLLLSLYQGKKGKVKRQDKMDVDSLGNRVFLYFSR